MTAAPSPEPASVPVPLPAPSLPQPPPHKPHAGHHKERDSDSKSHLVQDASPAHVNPTAQPPPTALQPHAKGGDDSSVASADRITASSERSHGTILETAAEAALLIPVSLAPNQPLHATMTADPTESVTASNMATPLPVRPAALSRSEPLLSTGTPLFISSDSLATRDSNPSSMSSRPSSASPMQMDAGSVDSPVMPAVQDGGETAAHVSIAPSIMQPPPSLPVAPILSIPPPVAPATPPLSPSPAHLGFDMIATPRPASAPPMVLPPPLPLPPPQFASYPPQHHPPDSPTTATSFSFGGATGSLRNVSSASPSPPQCPTPSSPKEAMDSAGSAPARVTVSSYLAAALFGADLPQGAELKTERLSNFLSVPYELEKTLWLGYIICLDAFLTIFTILPLRVVIATIRGFRKLMYHHVTLERNHVMDVWRAIILVFSCAVLYQIDPSWLYHTIRGQSMMKLYVIFNLLEVCDRLCCSFGIDILDSLFARSLNEPSSKRSLPILLHFALAGIYVTIHSVVLYYQMVTLNVSINSNSNSLLPLLISNQFVEIKSSVFKRFEAENLFQLTCADMTERMNLSVYLLLNVSRNFLELLNNTDAHMSLSLALPYVSWSFSPSLESLQLPSFVHSAWRYLISSIPHANSITLPTSVLVNSTQFTSALTHDSFLLLSSLSPSLRWWSYTGPAPTWLPVALDVLYPAMIVGLSEIVVDWLKHAFITKFNNIQPEQVYSRFRRVLCMDIVAATPTVPEEIADEVDGEEAMCGPRVERSTPKGSDVRGRPPAPTRRNTLLAVPQPDSDDDAASGGLASDTSTRTLTLTRTYPSRRPRTSSRSRSITPRRSLNPSPTPTSTPTRSRAPPLVVPATPSGLLRPKLGQVHSVTGDLASSSTSRDTSPSPSSSTQIRRGPLSSTRDDDAAPAPIRAPCQRRRRRPSLHPTQDMLPHVSRRLGFGALPLAVVTIRMTLDIFEAAALTWGFAWMDPPFALRLVPGTAKRAGRWAFGWMRRVVGQVGVVALVQSVPVNHEWVASVWEWAGGEDGVRVKVGLEAVDRFAVLVGAAGVVFIALLSLKILLGVTLLDQCLYQRQRWMANGDVVEPIGEPGSKKKPEKADRENGKDGHGAEQGGSGAAGKKQGQMDKLAEIDRYTLVKSRIP